MNVLVAGSKVGHVIVVAVNMSLYGLSPTTIEAAKFAAVSLFGCPAWIAPT